MIIVITTSNAYQDVAQEVSISVITSHPAMIGVILTTNVQASAAAKDTAHMSLYVHNQPKI